MDINQQIQVSLQIDYVFNNEESPPNSEDGDNLEIKKSNVCLHDYSYEKENDVLEYNIF